MAVSNPDQDRKDALLQLPAHGLKPQPFGTAYVYPYESKHGVSISIPTWESCWEFCEKGDDWKNDNIQWCYPRFFVNRPIRELAQAALQRLEAPRDGPTACLLFPTVAFAQTCAAAIAKKRPDVSVDIIQFKEPDQCNESVARVLTCARFTMVVFPDTKEVKGAAMSIWIFVGGGLTTRHAMFAMEHLEYLEAEHVNEGPKTVVSASKSIAALTPPGWIRDSGSILRQIRARIAELSSSESASLPAITAEHVILYPTGMNAIYHASEAMQAVAETSTVVAFGWLYDETVHILNHGSWQRFIGYKRGTEQDLQDLTLRLEAGERIGALFCELPSNIFLSTMTLPRLRVLADKYGFIIACDDTVAGFVNLDLMPYVDVMLTSLTKIFSGASDVTGGSVIVNPGSRYFGTIQSVLQAHYDPAILFPGNMQKLLQNSETLRWRAQKCNENALVIAEILHGDPMVERLNYPLYDASLPVYRSLMRGRKLGQGQAGYGHVMSVIFTEPSVARRFYDSLALPKGASFGTNFTIAIPFAIIMYSHDLEKAAKYGLPEHIIRISAGTEDVEVIKAAVEVALATCRRDAELSGT